MASINFFSRPALALVAVALAACGTLQPMSTANLLDAANEKGDTAYRNADYDLAIETWGDGLGRARSSGSTSQIGAFLTNLGVAYAVTGQYQRALTSQTEALAVKRRLGDRRGEAANLTNIGDIYWSLGLYNESLQYFEDALVLERRLRNPSGEAANLANLGAVHSRLGDSGAAVRYTRQALRINRALGNGERERLNLNNIGVFRKSQGSLREAELLFMEAKQLAEAAGDKYAVATSLGNLGLLYSERGRRDQAEEALAQSEELLAGLGDVDSLWKIQLGRGRVYAQNGDHDKAVEHYGDALEGIEDTRSGLVGTGKQAAYLQGKLVAYDELIALYQKRHELDPGKNYDAAALEVFERRQGRSFLEQMGKSGARRFSGLPDSIPEREKRLEVQIESLRSRIVANRARSRPSFELTQRLGELTAESVLLKEELENDYGSYFDLKYPSPASVEELQALLTEDETLLIYHVTGEDTLAWRVSTNSHSLHRLGIGRDALSKRIDELLDSVQILISAIQLREPEYRLNRIAEQLRGPWDEAAKFLYDTLFPADLNSAIKPGAKLYIVPTGALYDLPFGALIANTPDAKPRYLIEDHAIAYLSSASLLQVLRKPAPANSPEPRYPLLAFADPIYQDEPELPGTDAWSTSQARAYDRYISGRFVPIPEGAAAASALQALFDAPSVSDPMQLRERATRKRILAMNEDGLLDDYRYLFFSVHGILPGEVNRVVQPALVLSHPRDNGYLTMADVFGLNLNADLVTLSACNTARGDAVRGEGIMGLTRAFMYAGADTVGATLWAVESRSVQMLAELMHAGLSKGMGRAEALQGAMIQLLEDNEEPTRGSMYQHPYFWAPLILFGEGA